MITIKLIEHDTFDENVNIIFLFTNFVNKMINSMQSAYKFFYFFTLKPWLPKG